jgi:hypothetical protein
VRQGKAGQEKKRGDDLPAPHLTLRRKQARRIDRFVGLDDNNDRRATIVCTRIGASAGD